MKDEKPSINNNCNENDKKENLTMENLFFSFNFGTSMKGVNGMQPASLISPVWVGGAWVRLCAVL